MKIMRISIIIASIVISNLTAQDVPISVTEIDRDMIEKLPNSRKFLDILKIHAAVNISTTTNHADYNRRPGISIGVSTDSDGSKVPLIKNVPVLNTFRYNVGFQYEQLGSKLSTSNSWEGGKSSSVIKLRLNYLSFPMTFAYDLLFLPCQLYLMSGFTPRFLIGGTENWKYKSSYESGGMEYSDTQKGEEDIKDYTKTFDLGFVIGFGKPFSWKNHNFNLEATFEKGLFNIWDNSNSDSEDSGDSKLKNSSLKLTASYVLPIRK
jgi:hypothetical protein